MIPSLLKGSDGLSLRWPEASLVSASLYYDGFACLMLGLVSFVGFVVCRYSIRYLDGEKTQGRYFRWVAMTIGAVSMLVVSGNLIMLFAAWMLTSLGLHQLLLHYPERKSARRAAWTKFAISRVGDLFLLSAIGLVYLEFGTFELKYYDRLAGTGWTETTTDEISKYCSSHYDEGQASWSSPWQDLPLYQAWRSVAQVDRRIELLGLVDFRSFVADLPVTPEAAIFVLLNNLRVPERIWTDFLSCLAMTIPGWSAWAKYQTVESAKRGFENPDFAALLAIRLSYEVAISRQFEFDVDFESDAFMKYVAESDTFELLS